MANKNPSPATLTSLLSYDMETGVIKWKRPPTKKDEWGSNNGDGYKKGVVCGRSIHAHRVAWALHYGKWPKDHIDHINGDRGDNRMENLRDVTQVENQRNRKVVCTNTSGEMGVDWMSAARKWRARVSNQYLGLFDDKRDAVEAVIKLRDRLGYHENHGRRT